MKMMRFVLAGALLTFLVPLSAAAAPSGQELDKLYGAMSTPAYIKHYEVNKKDKFWLSPYVQVANKKTPGVLDPKLEKSKTPFNWVIDGDGNVRLTVEANNPYGRTYEKGAIRPEDKSKRKPGWTEKDGHLTVLAGEKGRIGGEIIYMKETNSWRINNKSGRYSNHNPDRTPEQLLNAVKLIKEVVDPAGAAWGDVIYLVRYSPQAMRPALLASPDIKYFRPDAKSEDILQKDPYLSLSLQ